RSLRLSSRTHALGSHTYVVNRHVRSQPIHNQNMDHKIRSLEWCSPRYVNDHLGAVNLHRSKWYGPQSHQVRNLVPVHHQQPMQYHQFVGNRTLSSTYTLESLASYWLNNWLPTQP